MHFQRVQFKVQGLIQGVGFRPFVKNLADRLGITGFVMNTGDGVLVEAEAFSDTLKLFYQQLQNYPGILSLTSLATNDITVKKHCSFSIETTNAAAHQLNQYLIPDRAPCQQCQHDMLNSSNRRYLYPFTSCTQCGPRYAISTCAPFDRVRTSLVNFPACSLCQQEYQDSKDRRFHSQTNCCPKCGPKLVLRDKNGMILSDGKQQPYRLQLLRAIVTHLRKGKLVALKGLGGFHLLADPNKPEAVQHLRKLKQRPSKPLALMYPNLSTIEEDCLVNATEKAVLTGSARPLVLLKTKKLVAEKRQMIAPNNAYLAAMLPTNGIYLLLMQLWKKALVVTSANRGGERLIGDYRELYEQFDNALDLVVDHNLPLQHTIDDSIVQVIDNKVMMLRLARGYAPLARALINKQDKMQLEMPPTIALGTYLKNTVATCTGNNVLISPYIGDLADDSVRQQRDKFVEQCIAENSTNTHVIVDKHPDFPLPANVDNLNVQSIQHHISHAFACEWEHAIPTPYLGVTWDGLGYPDKADKQSNNSGPINKQLWGGEFFAINENNYHRVASLLPIPLLGGDLAQREPRRIALAMLLTCGIDPASFIDRCNLPWTRQELSLLDQSIGSASYSTTAVGRLLDGIASLLNLCQVNSFEGEAPMNLQSCAQLYLSTNKTNTIEPLPYLLTTEELTQVDWRPTIHALLENIKINANVNLLALQVHQTLATIIVDIAKQNKQSRIALGGGCFQNRLLLECLIKLCNRHQLQLFWPQIIPPNDSGIAVGQLVAAYKAQQAQHKIVTQEHALCV
jgi:hydrogenase maturation protein HypF